MNHYTGYELLWLFFIYSFGGWVLETISATLKQRKFANRGFTILGCARLSGSEMVQWGHVDFITYSAEASDAYCAADTDRCTFCGYLWFLYASYRKE